MRAYHTANAILDDCGSVFGPCQSGPVPLAASPRIRQEASCPDVPLLREKLKASGWKRIGLSAGKAERYVQGKFDVVIEPWGTVYLF